MWEALFGAGASLLGGFLQGKSASAAGDAEAKAANAATDLNRGVYLDQRGLSKPGYLTGGAAVNKLAAQVGIAPQNYSAAFDGSGGSNPLANPNGQSAQWSSYLASNPDVMDYWKGNAKLREMYPNANDFAAYHYANFGQGEGRTLNASVDQTTQPVGGAQLEGRDGAAADPMADFLSSTRNKLATETSALDFGKIKGQLGAAGKTLSGAGEGRYAKTLAGNRYAAYGDYNNDLRSLAGMNETATSNIGGAGSSYASRAGTSMMAAGQAKGNALAGAYKGFGDGVAGVVGAVNKFGKDNWGWA